MKRVISLLVITVLCIGLCCPVLADEFVPSITAKDSPDIVPIQDEYGNAAIALLMQEDGTTVSYVYEECLVITPVSRANEPGKIPEAARQMLLDVYGKLNDGTMNLPYEKFNANLDPSTMVIRDLFDVSWLCGEGSGFVNHPDHPALLAPKGVTIQLTFDLGVSKNANVYTMTYKNGSWDPIVSTVNNGDGTVTCVFEDFCPVAFSVGSAYVTPPAQTGDPQKPILWIAIMSVAALGLVALVAVPALKKRRNIQ